jgi:hypothetical protein
MGKLPSPGINFWVLTCVIVPILSAIFYKNRGACRCMNVPEMYAYKRNLKQKIIKNQKNSVLWFLVQYNLVQVCQCFGGITASSFRVD